jgi:hypothetical protein
MRLGTMQLQSMQYWMIWASPCPRRDCEAYWLLLLNVWLLIIYLLSFFLFTNAQLPEVLAEFL